MGPACPENQYVRDRISNYGAAAALACLAALNSGGLSEAAVPSAEQLEFFETEIRPLLAQHCYACHSSKIQTPFAGLRLDSRAALLKGGDSGPAIQPGHPEESRLMRLLRGRPLQMPPTGVSRRKRSRRSASGSRWALPGRKSSRFQALRRGLSTSNSASARTGPGSPSSRRAAGRSTIKNGPPILSTSSFWPKLEEQDFAPAPPADRYTLIRRLSFRFDRPASSTARDRRLCSRRIAKCLREAGRAAA